MDTRLCPSSRTLSHNDICPSIIAFHANVYLFAGSPAERERADEGYLFLTLEITMPDDCLDAIAFTIFACFATIESVPTH